MAGCVVPADDRAQLFNDDGIQLFAQGDYRNALDSFDLALTLRPQDATLLFNLAECYDRLGDAKGAEKFYGACLVQAPKHADARLALTQLLYRTGRQPQADLLIADWVRQDPQSADVFVLDAWRLAQRGPIPRPSGNCSRRSTSTRAIGGRSRSLAASTRRWACRSVPTCCTSASSSVNRGRRRLPSGSSGCAVQGVSRPLPD